MVLYLTVFLMWQYFGSALSRGYFSLATSNLISSDHCLQWTELTHSGPDKGRSVPNVLEALALDEIRHTIGEVLIVSFHIVLQYQPTQGARWLILSGGEKTNKWKCKVNTPVESQLQCYSAVKVVGSIVELITGFYCLNITVHSNPARFTQASEHNLEAVRRNARLILESKTKGLVNKWWIAANAICMNYCLYQCDYKLMSSFLVILVLLTMRLVSSELWEMP